MIQFNPYQITYLAKKYGTPLWVYDSITIKNQIAKLHHFDVVRYAQKACSNIHILHLMREAGLVIDAVSLGEIKRSLRAGFSPLRDSNGTEGIVFTADLIDMPTLNIVLKHNITVNAGSLDMLRKVGESSLGHRVWLRINPGFGHGHSAKTNTGGEHSKHGIWLSDLPHAIKIIKHYGLKLVGLHMHIGSGVDYNHLTRVCDAMVDVVKGVDHDIEAISAGGGLPIPYKEDDSDVNTDHYYELWDTARKKIERYLGHSIRLEIEPGRFLTAQAGVLISEVHAVKSTPSHQFALIDAGFNELVRPSLYGSYHKITLLRSDGQSTISRKKINITVAGPLCEAGDIFTLKANGEIGSYLMPEPALGDFLLFHDVGAYGAAMSSNYNSRPLAAEILIERGEAKLIRRRQTIEDLIQLEEILPDY